MKSFAVRSVLAGFCLVPVSVAPLASCATGGANDANPPGGTGEPDATSLKADAQVTQPTSDGAPGAEGSAPTDDGSVTDDDAPTTVVDADVADAAPGTDASVPDAADASIPDANVFDANVADAADAAVSIPTVGLVGAWLCSGSTIDTSGNANNGTGTNIAFSPDRHNVASAACSFDGTSAYISIPNTTSLSLTTTWSFSGWVRPAGFSALAGILSKYHSDNARGPVVRLSYNSPFSGIDVNEATNSTNAVAGALAAAAWSHVAVTVNGTAVSCYINGALAYSATAGYSTSSNGDTLDIGLDYTNRYFAGAIDDVRLYNRVITTAEIQALYAE